MKFTYEEYRSILDTLQSSGYVFGGYHEVLGIDKPACFIRHDMDLDVGKAIALAEIERSAGVYSTYCVMVRSSAYNVFSSENTRIFKTILAMGHYLGLHFDCDIYADTATVEELASACLIETKLLEGWLGHRVRIVSYHKPSALVLAGTSEVSHPLPHTYMAKFMKEMTYLSDSYGFWRFGHPLLSKAFQNRESLNLSIHPIWWNPVEKSSLYCLTMAMRTKKEEIRQYMLNQIVGV